MTSTQLELDQLAHRFAWPVRALASTARLLDSVLRAALARNRASLVGNSVADGAPDAVPVRRRPDAAPLVGGRGETAGTPVGRNAPRIAPGPDRRCRRARSLHRARARPGGGARRGARRLPRRRLRQARRGPERRAGPRGAERRARPRRAPPGARSDRGDALGGPRRGTGPRPPARGRRHSRPDRRWDRSLRTGW